MKYQELENTIKTWFKDLSPVYKKAFISSFVIINIAFLFHTVNFMFGDHDWLYVRSPNYWSEGAFEGRPLHFVLQSLFFGGHVLPILNNLFSFAALALSGVLLARYWQIPLNAVSYALFATYVAVLPYTMVWLFYAKDALINLSLPLIAILGLVIADMASKKRLYHLLAIALFYFAFASYVAVINLLAVCFIGKVLADYIKQKSFIKVVKEKLPAVADMIIALVLFKLTLACLSLSSDYNTKVVDWAYLPEKLVETLTVMFTQFTVPTPFMEPKYKYLLLVISLGGLGCGLYKGGKKKVILSVILVLGMLFATKLAFFMADERGQVLAEMENFAFVPRLDFYGLAYVYAFGLALLLSYYPKKWKKWVLGLAMVAAFMSVVRDVYAQKVWKLGFDAEMKAHERIVGRLEQMPEFRTGHKYKILQLGSLSLRKNFYREVAGEAVSLDMLSTSFTPQYMSRIVYNFYYPEDIFYDNASVSDLSERGREFLRTAKVYPALGSMFIDGDIVIVVLTEEGLAKALGH